MIEQGTDGVSRGNLPRSTFDKSLCMFVPLHLSALDQSPALLSWVKTWIGQEFMSLQPSNWFVEGHDLRHTGSMGERHLSIQSTTCLWSPLPSIGDVAIE